MAKRGELSWTQLRVGLLVMVALMIFMVAIFYITGRGKLLAGKYTLVTYLPEAQGLKEGAPVRLAGVEVGNVDRVQLSPYRGDTARSVAITMRVLKSYQQDIRADSKASLITEGLLGERMVDITRGSQGPPVADGGTVQGKEEAAIKLIIERTNEVVSNLSVMTDQIRDIVSRVQAGQGTLGKLVKDETLYHRVNAAVDDVHKLTQRAAAGEGTFGKLMVSDELYDRANATMKRVEAMVADVEAGKGTVGKFLRDEAMAAETKQMVERINSAFGDIEAGKGTLGKLAKDPALYDEAKSSFSNLNSVTRKLDRGQGTFEKLIDDPKLYDNANGLAEDLRGFVADFRANPKKYMRFKFGVLVF